MFEQLDNLSIGYQILVGIGLVPLLFLAMSLLLWALAFFGAGCFMFVQCVLSWIQWCFSKKSYKEILNSWD